MTHKFKVGDKVKILDGKNIDNYTGGWGTYMRDFIGDTLIVTELTERGGKPAYMLSDKYYIWDERGLELVESSSPITKVIFNPPATIVLWNDGTKTVVKCHVKDRYSKEIGLAMCISKKLLDNRDDFYEEFKKWIPDEPIDACQSFESIGASFGRACEAFRVGFLKGAEEFNKNLKAKETEGIPVEEMRERLCEYCERFTFCTQCPLNKPCECGRGKHFVNTDPTSTGYLTDNEIRDAYNRVFGKKKED